MLTAVCVSYALTPNHVLYNFHVSAGDDPHHGLHTPHYHWSHAGYLKTFDHQAYAAGMIVGRTNRWIAFDEASRSTEKSAPLATRSS